MYLGGQRLLRAASPAGRPQPRPERHSKTELPAGCFCRHDFNVNSEVAAKWFARVKAPSKQLVWFENSALLPMTEEPGKFLISLVRYARPTPLLATADNQPRQPLMSQTIGFFSDFQRFQVVENIFAAEILYGRDVFHDLVFQPECRHWLQCRSRGLYPKADFTSFGCKSFRAQAPR